MTTAYRRYHLASHLTVLVGIIANAVAELDALIFLIGATGVGVSYFVFRDRLISPIPRWVANTMLVAALVLMFRAATGELADVVSVIAQYLVYLQLIKLFESRTPRDQAQMLMLSLLVAISAVLTSVTLQVALVLLLYLPLAFWSVVLYQVYAGQLRTHDQRVRAGLANRNHPPSKAFDRLARRTVRRLVGLTMVGVAVTSAAVFFLMPRNIGGGAFGDWQPASYGAATGFNNEVRLGRPGTITESPTVVMEVSFHMRLMNGEINPWRENQTHRLRGAVLDDFDPDSAVWFRSRDADKVGQHGVEVFPGDRFPFTYETDDANVEIRASVRNLTSSELFTLWKPEKFAIPGVRRRLTVSPIDGVARLRNHRGPISYAVLTNPDAPTRVETGQRRTIFERPDNHFASDDSRIRALALEIIGDRVPGFDPDNPRSVLEPEVSERIVDLLTDHLSNNYAYTLDMMIVPDGQDPIETFLFESPAGHCEYFASALAALCRSVWIDARVVTGFVATEYNPENQTYTVRQSHAHAWVEALISRRTGSPSIDGETEPRPFPAEDDDARGDSDPSIIETWKTYDPSPRLSLEAVHRPPGGVFARLGQWFDELQFAWSSNVIGFDRDRQAELLRSDSSGPLGIFDRARSIAENVGSERIPGSVREDLTRSLLSFATLGAVFAVVAGLAVIAKRLVQSLVRRLIASSNPEDAETLRRKRQTRFFDRAQRLLERAGLARPAHLPASVHAHTIERDAPGVANALSRLTDLYYESRYGGRLLTGEELASADKHLEALERELSARR
jgi:transglutaminase-like putative cysteine protease